MSADRLSELQRRIDLLVNETFDQAYLAIHPLIVWKGDTMPTSEQPPTPEPTQPTDDYIIKKLADQAGGIAHGAETATQATRRQKRDLDQLPWEDLTTGQQVERMRSVVKQFENTNRHYSRLLQELSERIAALEEHDHLGEKVVVPVRSKQWGHGHGGACSEEKAPGWF